MFFHLEAIQFASTIFDTNDISTIRGGSILNESLPKGFATNLPAEITAKVIADGGSKLILKIDPDQKAKVGDLLQRFLASDPWVHLVATWGFGETPVDASNEAAKRAASLWSVPKIDDGWGKVPCDIDHIRTASVDSKKGDRSVKVSTSVHARRTYGRKIRPGVFDGTDSLSPPRSFEDIVKPHSRDSWTPLVVKGKLAVVAADGIGGEKLRKKLGETDMRAFMVAFKKRISDALCDWLEREGLIHEDADTDETQRSAQMDVLFWGGDDMRFIVPAHSVVSFIQELLDLFETPTRFGAGKVVDRFPHRIGAVIAQHKVPFRQLNALSETLEYSAKAAADQTQSAVCMAIFESASPPYDNLHEYWNISYGPGHCQAFEVYTKSEFERLVQICANLDDFGASKSGISITQINRLLRMEGVPRKPLLPKANDPKSADTRILENLGDYFDRVVGETFVQSDAFGSLSETRGLALLLSHVAQTTPYVQASLLGGTQSELQA